MGIQSNALTQPGGFSLPLLIAGLLALGVLVVLLILLGRRQASARVEAAELRARLGTEAEKAARLDTEVRLRDERLNTLTGRLSALEARREAEQTELKERVRELDKTRSLLEAEQRRIAAEELQRRREEEALRDRMWNLHEREAIARMTEVCRKSDILLPCYTNTDLPEDLDPSLKPDFLISLLGQYVIFDAKVSRAQNLQTYVSGQVKKTAEKLSASRDRQRFYPRVFFVVPASELPGLKQTSWYEQGYTFFAVSLEAFEPLVRTLKLLEDYEFAGRFDPQDREAIVDLVAALEQHIRRQNADNILGTLRGLAVLAGKDSLPEDLAEAVEKRRKTLRIEQFRPTELKKLMDDPDNQLKEIGKLIRPSEPEIPARELTESLKKDQDIDA